jgi:hypothetical protein
VKLEISMDAKQKLQLPFLRDTLRIVRRRSWIGESSKPRLVFVRQLNRKKP